MSHSDGRGDYSYKGGKLGCAHDYLLPQLAQFLAREQVAQVFEVGCGNGSVAAWMHGRKVEVTGIDFSLQGIEQAKKYHPQLLLEQGSAYDDLAGKFGHFPAVVSLEVVEHLFDPRRFAEVLFELLLPGGKAFVSTPYHGYLKNLALALTGKMDAHFTALWVGGHIKFWSQRTIAKLFADAGFEDIEIHRVGRVPALAKAMVVIARKPLNS